MGGNMLFTYELKKVLRRVSPLAILIVLLLTSFLTVSITGLCFNTPPEPTPDVSTEYSNLVTQINNWDATLDRNSFMEAFNSFYADYKTMNASTFNGTDLVNSYNKAKSSFNKFYINYYQQYINGDKSKITQYLLIQEQHLALLDEILVKLDSFFQSEYTEDNKEDIIHALEMPNNAWEDASLKTILEDLFYVQTISNDDLNQLKKFFINYPANQEGFDYTNAYEYALNKYWLAVESNSEYNGHLSRYEGFELYQNSTLSQQACKLAAYRLQHADKDFTTPYAFGKIYAQTEQVSLLDFVFTNMEMAMILVTVLVTIWATSAFFTDSHQNTLISPITAGKKRSTIVVSKMLVVILLALISILILTGIYLTIGVLIFNAYFSPDILFLLNETTPVAMSAINYYVLYFLSLIFKLLPLIAISGLLSFTRAKPFVIIGIVILLYTAIASANIFLSNFAFYEYVPFLGLNPISYCGTDSLLSTMPSTYNIWYTFPAMFGITIILYVLLVQKFRRHDFY